ncbi:GNAT family N-acetyltransferase [Aliiroseovarius crassostreae]|uniref:GNAT family N-acetyltransferase n=1 Tax=Aliiroseovarius crassostreae TaxID=154981 RepID=UPI00220F5378|nr:GNAT family N-acetyltransferase [Aliiroseovarius crassostreae]UWP92851.1 GNAT family N-acetyltransferase [Aliiroseovarius crassostreae]
MTRLSGIPTLTTDRLTLRAPAEADFEHVATFFASKERSWGFGGPLDRTGAWRWFATNIGHFALKGFGFWFLETAEGETVGMVGLWGPEGWNETELGWVMFEGAEGKGYAREAAEAVRAHAYDTLGWDALCSNIFPGNARSVTLAERMGARLEAEWDSPTHGTELVYRHPSKQELAEMKETRA